MELALQTLALKRCEVFGSHDVMPSTHNSYLDKTARPTFVGRNYRPGGVLILGKSPGGGGAKYKGKIAKHDGVWERAVKSLVNRSSIEVYRDWRDQIMPSCMHDWSIWTSVSAVLEAIQLDLHQVAFGNLIPFRIEGAESENIRTVHIKLAWEANTKLVIETLAPKLIVGMTSSFGKFSRLYEGEATLAKFRRARGDRYITESGEADLNNIRAHWIAVKSSLKR